MIITRNEIMKLAEQENLTFADAQMIVRENPVNYMPLIEKFRRAESERRNHANKHTN